MARILAMSTTPLDTAILKQTNNKTPEAQFPQQSH